MSRFIFLSLLSLIFFASFTNGNVYQEEEHQKIYISLEDVIINEDSIHVFIDDELVPVLQLNVDDVGLYIETIGHVPAGLWQCPRCWYVNSLYTTTCVNCGWPKEKK